MLVKCTQNRVASLKPTPPDSISEFSRLDEVNLRKGAEYVVLGVVFRGGYPWYLVVENEDDTYPIAHFWGFFSVLDSSIGPDWQLAWSNQLGGAALLPRQWSQDAGFMENLVEGDKSAVAQFRGLKRAAEARYSR